MPIALDHNPCKTIGCKHSAHFGEDFCTACITAISQLPHQSPEDSLLVVAASDAHEPDDIPDGSKHSVKHLEDIDIYAVHHLFSVDDPSGCLHRASAKILISGQYHQKDRIHLIERARNLLNRWLEINRRK